MLLRLLAMLSRLLISMLHNTRGSWEESFCFLFSFFPLRGKKKEQTVLCGWLMVNFVFCVVYVIVSFYRDMDLVLLLIKCEI